MLQTYKHLFRFKALLILFFCLASASALASPAYVWIESESQYTLSPDTVAAAVGDAGRPQYLSGGKWLQINIPADQVGSSVPTSGITVTYQFNVTTAGSYQIWNRVGFEAVRSNFDWRVDNGVWTTSKSTDNTTDVEELQTWNPVGWLNLGSQTLSEGTHSITFRITKQTDRSGKLEQIIYASDAICLYNGDFHPNDQYRPDDNSYSTDADRLAATNVFNVPTQADSGQSSTPLDGDWQIARDDEGTVSNPSGPIQSMPAADSLYWKSITVPGNRDQEVPAWTFAHRYWLRTRLNVPSTLDGRSFYIHFPSTSMIATVFVNGQSCGYSTAPFAAWDCDITKAIKPGQTNELWVGIKDWYYALPGQGAVDGGHIAYIPTDWVTKYGPATFTFPVWNHTESGIIHTPELVVAGPVYTSDVFAKPSVKTGSLGLDITLQNSSPTSQQVTVNNDIVPLTGDSPVKSFAPMTETLAVGESITVSQAEPFPNAKLWWSDAPYQYNVLTTISIGGKPADQRRTKFGFREWTWSNGQFALNGVPWHGRADAADYGRADDEATALWQKHGQNMQRMWGEDTFSGLTPDEALDYYDSHGIAIRRTGIFDGEMAAYNLLDGNHVNQQLFDNWRNQLLTWAKCERNHPSIFLWSIENEIAFINAKVTGESATVDPAESQVAKALQVLDPTRPVITDGGNALLDQSLPVYGCHYIEPSFNTLPEGAYNVAGFVNSQIWPITQTKPIFLGESYYANGDQPSDLATVGGEYAFLGKAEEHPAIGLAGKMYSEGLRWNGVSFHFWTGGVSDAYYNSWQPVAVLCRQWDWTFGSGSHVARTLRIFNDTHDSSPITLKSSLVSGSKVVQTSSQTYIVAPGGQTTISAILPIPVVQTRSLGVWKLTLLRSGTTVFQDAHPFSVLPKSGVLPVESSNEIAVFDPSGLVQGFLKSRNVVFTSLTNITTLPKSAKVLVVGANALTVQGSTSSKFAAYASSGHSVIVLNQTNPLKFQALPSDLQPTSDSGDIGFAEDLDNPVFKGLTQNDFFTWAPDGVLYSQPYLKSASSGGRSLLECGEGLADTGLVEFTPGSGLMLLSQLEVGSKLTASPTAGQLLLNMIDVGLTYKLVYRQTVVDAGGNVQLTDALNAIHLQYSKTDDVLYAISQQGAIAIIDATLTNLSKLAAAKAAVDRFTGHGGWIIFNNFTPDGISPYNQLVGVNHLIRPFGQEKVSFPPTRNHLILGLSPSDIVMGNGHNIFGWEAGQYADSDAFSYVVDTDDVAPFCSSPFFGWSLITNGFTMADGFWPLITNFPAPIDGKPFDIPINLPVPETITGFTYVGDNNYWPQTKLNLQFGATDNVPLDYDHGDPAQPATPETYAINPPRSVSKFDLQITGWNQLPNVTGTIGIDNISISVKRPADFAQRVKPLLNIGALVEYPHGLGGIVLCNVKFKDPLAESNPENTGKKQAIISAILKNLSAQFSGGKSIIAGANNLTCTPISLKSNVNQYINDLGWFGDKSFTFADFPIGRQTLAGVPYGIYGFTTSPVPTVAMLQGNGVPGNLPDTVTGILVNQKADALFFLQAARIDYPLSNDDLRRQTKSEIADYIVHYADGTTETAPIYCQVNVDTYKQQFPNPLPDAQIAWVHPYAGTNQSAVAYSMQWLNPHPEKEITIIDLKYGPDRWRGVPCLIALTAATVN